MATISKSSAQVALTATCTPTRVNVSNSAAVGAALATKTFTDANVVYSIKATATTTSDEATLMRATGDVSTSGSPTILGSGVDFEGEDVGTATTLYAILVEQTVDGAMDVAGSFTSFQSMAKSGDKARWVWNDGLAITSHNLILDLDAIGVAAEVTVIGKTA